MTTGSLAGSPEWDGPTLGQPAGNLGTVYVYQWDAARQDWQFAQQLQAPNPRQGEAFGYSLALQGNRLVVGCQYTDTRWNDSQRAYVFELNGTQWAHTATLAEPNPRNGAFGRFGHSVALSGDRIAVGNPRADYDSGGPNIQDAGRVVVFRLQGGQWAVEAELDDAPGRQRREFGQAVALEGDRLFISRNQRLSGSEGPGMVQVYAWDGQAWQRMQAFSGGQPRGSLFGFSLAVEGDTLLVGSPFSPAGALPDGGQAFVYAYDGTQWQLADSLSLPNPQTSDRAGVDVALSLPYALVGAPGRNALGVTNRGAGYLFRSTATGWSIASGIRPTRPQPDG